MIHRSALGGSSGRSGRRISRGERERPERARRMERARVHSGSPRATLAPRHRRAALVTTGQVLPVVVLHPPPASTSTPNVVFSRRRHGIEVLHLYTGRTLTQLPLPLTRRTRT